MQDEESKEEIKTEDKLEHALTLPLP